jgi:hypothetical protein
VTQALSQVEFSACIFFNVLDMLVPVHFFVDSYSQDTMMFHHSYFCSIPILIFILGFMLTLFFASVNQHGFCFFSGDAISTPCLSHGSHVFVVVSSVVVPSLFLVVFWLSANPSIHVGPSIPLHISVIATRKRVTLLIVP